MEGITPGYLQGQVYRGEFISPAHYGKPNRWLKPTIDRCYERLNQQAALFLAYPPTYQSIRIFFLQ